MNLNRLRALIAVVEAGGFSSAARVLGMSQPGVSQQIKALEQELNAQLLERGGDGTRLTRSGALVYERAKRIVGEWRQLQEALSTAEGGLGGRLTLGASTIPSTYLLPEIICRFRKAHPGVEIRMEVGSSEAVASWVAQRQVDAGFTGMARPGDAHLQFQPFSADRLLVIAPCGHPLASKRRIQAEELRGVPFVSRRAGSGTRAAFEKALANLNVRYDELQVVAELGSTEAVIGAVEAGLGVAVVSSWAVRPALALRRVCACELEGPPIQRNLWLCVRKDRAEERLIAAFASLALEGSGPQPSPPDVQAGAPAGRW